MAKKAVVFVKELLKSNNWFSGLQWLFFIFTNIIVIPITVGAAFDLSQTSIISLLQLSFIVTGVACMVQALIGHKRAIMEGQSGLWWGVILTLVNTAVAQGIPLAELGGSLAIGVMISGVLTVIIGLTGTGPQLAKLFSPAVMGVFMFLFGCKLVGIFMKGMLGIPFGNDAKSGAIDISVSLLSIAIAIMVIIISIKAPTGVARYSLLIGIILGWIAFVIFIGPEPSVVNHSSFHFEFFPLGRPSWHIGIIITAVITGLLNTANTFGALKGTDAMYKSMTTNKQYSSSITITGVLTGISGLFGLVPYAPYVSSIGFLNQTGIIKRLPFILGGFMFLLMGLIPSIGSFFSRLPLSIGSAVLFVSYLLLLHSSFQFFKQVKFNAVNIYRSAIPLFVGIIIMTMPSSYFVTLPSVIRPLASSGLLMGIILALLMENLFSWDRYGATVKSTEKAQHSNSHVHQNNRRHMND